MNGLYHHKVLVCFKDDVYECIDSTDLFCKNVKEYNLNGTKWNVAWKKTTNSCLNKC